MLRRDTSVSEDLAASIFSDVNRVFVEDNIDDLTYACYKY